MILSYSEYREVINEDFNDDTNYEFDVLLHVIEGLYEHEYLSEEDMLQLFANIAEKLEIEYSEDLTLDEWVETFSPLIAESITEDNQRVFHLTDECIGLYESDVAEVNEDNPMPTAAGGLHQKARSVRGAYDAIRGAEGPKKWYDVIGGHACKAFKGYNKSKVKMARVQDRATKRGEKQNFKLAKLQAKADVAKAKYGANS